MRTYEIAAPDGKTYEIEGPEGATKAQLVQFLLAKNPYAGQSTQELQETGRAPSKLKDVGIAALTGLAGGAQSLTDLFGAGNIASRGLSSVQQSAQEGLSEARKAEIARDEELKKRAEGSFLNEAGAGFRSFANAPLQEGIQALFSSAPIIAAGALTGGAGAVPLTAARAGLAARAAQAGRVATSGTGVGAAMGLGGQKGQDYETVKRELMARGMPEPEAEAKAQEAAAYSLQNLPRQAIAAGAGALEGRYGVEGALSNFMKQRAATAAAGKAFTPELPPGYGKAAVSSIFGEVIPEGIQAATGQVGTNIALTQAGIPTDALQGVTSAVAHDAAVAALLGTAVTPFQKANMVREFNQTMIERQQKAFEEDAKRREEFERKRQEGIAKTRQELGIEEKPMLALPAPAEKLEAAPPVTDPLMNPLGNLTKDELGRAVGIPDVYRYVDKYRRDNGLPKLESYSIEDLKDAQPGLAESGEAGALNSIIAFKSGFTADAKVTADDVLGMALRRNVETGTKGFDDFLTRTTGVDSLDQMEPPQLFAVHQALAKLPEPAEGGAPIILPQGTNAKLFKQNQYDQAISAVDTALSGQGLSLTPGPMTEQATLDVIKQATGLTLDKHAKALMDTAVQKGDLDLEMTPKYEVTDPATGVRVGDLYETRKEAQAAAKRKGLNVNEVTETAIVAPKTATVLPDEFDIQEGEFKAGEAPDGFDIMAGDKVLRTEPTYESAAAKIEGFTKNRQRLSDKASKDIVKAQEDIQASEDNLNKMASLGQANTLPYQIAEGKHANLIKEKKAEIEKLNKQLDFFNPEKTPISIKPRKLTPVRRRGLTVLQKGIPSATFPTRTAAEEHIIANMSDQQLKKLTKTEGRRTLAKRALAELQAREDKKAGITKGIEVKRSDIEREPEVSQEVKDKIAELEKFLLPALRKLGLNDVALKVEQSIAGGAAGGSYLKSLIKIAIDEKNPLLTMRHEALHALKDLGFFTPQQWATLERKARTEWVGKYLRQRNADGEPIKPGEPSRYDAYEYMNIIEPTVFNEQNPDKPQRTVMSQADFMDLIIEEAIADAFADFTVNKPPPGMIAALMQRLNKFFEALRNAMAGAGFQTVDDIFGKVEAGELKALGQGPAGAEKKSLRAGFQVPLSTVDLMEGDTTVARRELGLRVAKEPGERAGQLNNVRQIAIALNKQTLDTIGKMDRNNPTEADAVKLAEAMADEVMYQLGTTSTTGTGLGWYSHNYPNAVKRLARRFPELENNRHAQAVFTALVAITSNGEKVKKNISNAINLYAKLRMGKSLVAMGNRRATALQNNLQTLQDLLVEHGENFEQHLLKETTVADMNVELRARGKKPDASYLAETTVPTAAIYFGPKLGAFYANLSGSEGYLTMDLWWTRTINRMRGLLIPMATAASIGKFRTMMDRPDATREEVIAAAVPLRDKYLDYGYNTELEHLVKSKEPAKKFAKPAWFKRAEQAAGDSYEQLLYEHNLEKMANTIYKNEYDMLAEAPFTASDRKFMYDIGRKTQTLLRNRGVSLTLADIQAALWYYEKRLYQKLSGRKADDIGYEEAIIDQANESTGRARPSVVFTGGLNGGAVATGKIEGSEGVREESAAEEPKLSVRGTNENIRSAKSTVRPSGGGNEKINYGPKYSLREDIRSYRGRNEMQSRTHTGGSLGDGTSVRVLGAKPIAKFAPTDSFKGIVNEHGNQSPVFYEISGKDADVYEQAIQGAKDSSPYGAAVYVYPVDAYADMRLFLTEDGKSGFALKGDDIVSVFSGPPHKGSVNSSIQLAVQEGGRRLDAFATVLPSLYNANGFQVVGRMKWNEDYKPDDWDKQTFAKFNNGEPDVVYMAYNPDDNRTIFENPGEYFDDPDELAQAQRDAVNAYYNEGTGYGSAQQAEASRGLKAQTGTVSGQRGVRRGIQLLDDETRAKYPGLEEPVKGLPATVKVDGVDVTFGPYVPAREAAILYAEESGLPYRQQASYHKLDPEFSKMLASSYARMIDEPNAPQVKAAYKAWADETIAQYKAMLKTGITVEFFPDAIDTYGNPRNSILDVLNNNHLYVFPADGGFGKDAITDEQIRNNPALALTDIIISGRRARVVEVFRATHDFYGHIKEGFGFRAEGEENAFQSHVRMYSPLAARAMTAGTRGQNSEVNYGPNADFNKTASGKDTKYADQKIGLLPEWASTMEIEPDISAEPASVVTGKGVVLGTLQPGAASFRGAHYGNAKVNTLNGDKYGTGIRGAESKRLAQSDDERINRRVYFYTQKPDGTMPTPEAGLGQYVYTQQFDNILPPGVESDRLSDQAKGNSNDFESLVVDAGYDGYAIPDMGMMVILNHNAPVEYRGTRVEMAERGEKLSIRPPPLVGRIAPNTPEFKRFFNGSKAVNDDGSPRLMFHGTVETPNEEGNLFSTFNLSDDGKLGSGVYTTSVPVYAETFGFSQPALMPLYLSAKNPYYIELGDFPTRMKGDNLALTDDAFKALETQMKEAATKLSGKRLMDLEGSQVRKMFEKAGYDSIIARDSYGNIIEALAFKPEQVKSATGNVGTYDPTNPNIRLSVRNIIGDPKVIDFYMTKTFAREEKGHAARMLEAITPPTYTSLRQMFLNQYDSLARLDNRYAKAKGIVRLMADSSAEAAALMSDMAAGVAARVIGMGGSPGGAPVYRNGATYIDNKNGTIKGPAEIFAPLAKYNDPDIYRAYQVWAGVKRGSRYMQNPNGTYEEKLFNGKDDIAYADFLLSKFPEFKQVQADWNVYNDGLVDYMVSTGVISKEGGEKFKKHGDYIPFYRQLEGEETIGPKVFQNISGVKPPKKAKGSEAPLADFLETVVRNTQAAIQSGMKNAAAIRTVDMLVDLDEATKIHKPTGISTVSLMRDGKIEHYDVKDVLLVDSLKSLNLAKLPGLGFLSGPANLLRSLVTKDPGFMLANLMRDSMSAWVTSGQNFKPGIDTIRYFGKALAGNSPEVEALLNFGMGGYEFSKGVEQSGRDLAETLKKKTEGERTFGQKVLRVFPSIWEGLEKGTTASDMATRAAIYKKVMEETGNETEALMRALEVMNFNRRGNSVVVRIATAAIPFFNARMQGLDVLYRAGIRPYIQGKNASDYEKQIAKTFAIRGLTMMAVSALYWAMTHDDDEYLAQEQETRDNNWLLPSLGMRVPIPFEVGVLFKVIPERLLELSFGNDTGKDFSEAMVRNIKSSLFMDLMPQTIKPIYEVTTNYNFYTRRPIVGQGSEGLADVFQVGPGTSSFAEGLGKMLGFSPLKVDHLIKAYTGTIGMYAVDTIDLVIDANSDVPKATKRFEQMPFIKRFALDAEARGKVTAYYDLKNSVDEVVRTINHLEKAGNYEEMGEYMKDNMRVLASKEYISALEKEMKSFREVASMIRNSKMSGDEKRDALLAVTQAQNKLTGNVQEIKKMIASGD